MKIFRYLLGGCAFFAATTVAGCGGGTICGAGTQDVEGTCVPSAAPVTCGDGTAKADGECRPTGDPLDCGAGTVAVDGACVPEYEQVLCGEGTVLADGSCVPAPIEITDIQVTHLRVGDGTSALQMHNPVEVTLGIAIGDTDPATADDSLKNQSVVVALQSGEDGAFCLLGSFLLDQPSDGTEHVYTDRFFIDADCAQDSAQNALTLPLALSPVVLIDPYGDLSLTKPELEEPVDFTPGAEDPRTGGCVQDAENSSGDCRVTLSLEEAGGVEFEVNRVDVRTQAVVLPEVCDPNAAEWANVPEAYRCNGSIVQNADGNWVYGPPDIQLDLTLLAWGVDHKSVVEDPADHQPPNLLDEEDLEIAYSIKPTSAADTDWMPLYMHSEGDPAKAADEIIPDDMVAYVATDAPPKSPVTFSHGLYIENDCGENNTATCDATINPRDEMLTGAWAAETLFDVRACVESAAEDVDAATDDNCVTSQIIITREGGLDPGAIDVNFDWRNDQSFGNEWVALNTIVVTEGFTKATGGDVNSAFGARAHAGALMAFRSDRGGFSVNMVWGNADGAANQNQCLLGTCSDMLTYGAFLRIFDYQIWGHDASHGTEISYSTNPSWSRSYGRSFWYNFGPATVEVNFGTGAEAGIEIETGLNLAASTSDWMQPAQGFAAGVGGYAKAKPYGRVWVSVTASVSAVVVRAGAHGTVNIVNGGLPMNLNAEASVDVDANDQILRGEVTANASFELSLLSGYLEVFIDHRWVTCSWWDGCWITWSRWYTWRLATWGGWTYGYQLFNTRWRREYNFATGSLTSG